MFRKVDPEKAGVTDPSLVNLVKDGSVEVITSMDENSMRADADESPKMPKKVRDILDAVSKSYSAEELEEIQNYLKVRRL